MEEAAPRPARPSWRLIAETVQRLARPAIDLVLPPRCLGCGAIVQDTASLCPSCWRSVTFLTPPVCASCGQPFTLPPPAEVEPVCVACIAKPPPWQRGRAVVRYDDGSRRLVWALKHGDRTDLAPALGAWMARAAADLVVEADLVVPVPLYRWRLFRRRYNQAALLAQAMLRALPAAQRPRLVPDALVRVRGGTQAGKRRGQRQRGLQGAFRLRPGVSVRGLRVLLVDDVHTSGATFAACTRVLMTSGALRVDVVSFARVPLPGG
ncbi:MAG: ComF family protein [Alphaproteobacteria bacterium]|nr:ComF family protein [Alphaproteobacteria bacterium]